MQKLMMRLDALKKFKTQLVKDLGTTGYSGPLTRTTGAAVPAGKLTGTENDLSLRSVFGLIPLNWGDISIDSLIAMSKSFITPTLPPAEAAERKWATGNFALVMGRTDAARELLNAAAEAKPEYKDAVATLLAPPEKKDAEKK